MSQPRYSFLIEPLKRALATMPWLAASPGELSVYVIQLKEPDFWFIFTFRSEAEDIRLLFEGTWIEAVNHFAARPTSFPDSAPEGSMFDDIQTAFRNTILEFPKKLVSGHTGYSTYSSGVLAFQSPGVLNESGDLYFEHLWETSLPLRPRPSEPPFKPANHERDAYYCRFLIPSESGNEGELFKAQLNRAIGNDIEFETEHGWHFRYSDVDLILLKNGILIADERHTTKAIEALNSFLAFTFLQGVDCDPLRIQEVSSVHINRNGIVSHWSGLKLPKDDRAKSLSLQAIGRIIAAFNFQTDVELNLEIRLLHLAFYHLRAEEYLQSFTLAWIVLERRMTKLWRETLLEKGYSGPRLDRLCDSDQYTMSVKIDMLEVSQVLRLEQAQKLSSIRKARNKATHEGRIPTKEATEDCLRLAREFIFSQSSHGTPVLN